MPIIDPGSEPQLKGGMTRERIIATANARTGNIAEQNRLDLDQLFLEVLQDFCSEHRWFWRKRSISFYTQAGTAEYDLASDANDSIDCEEILSVKYFKDDGSWTKLDAIFDTDEQDAAEEQTTQGEPARYFIKRGTNSIVRIVNVPNAAYKLRFTFWALPNTTSDQQPDTIPLVPGFHHHILVKGLIAAITGDPKDMAVYQAAKDRASEVRDFALGRARDFVSADDAIRSC